MRERICKLSLFSFILACVSAMPLEAAVKVNNSKRSYSNAYQQINALQYQQAMQDAALAEASVLPIEVSDKTLAESISNNTSNDVTVSDLEACSMIYPNGAFKWGVPESGVRRNPGSQCVAIVELVDTNTKAVLATTTLAAGDTMKCNVDSFPESGMSFDLKNGKVEVPADTAPTMDYVEAVMNEEQKQNAGIKIAAGAIISGLAGNLLAPKDAGDTKMFGASKTQLIDTAIGVATGAGIMAASTYSGKVAGDTIKSTAVNAASGMVVGNMLAGTSGSDSVLATTKCKVDSTERDCIIGNCATVSANKITNGTMSDEHYFISKKCNEIIKCSTKKEDNTFSNCTQVSKSKFVDIMVSVGSEKKLCSATKDSDYSNATTYLRQSEDLTTMKQQEYADFVEIASASEVTKTQHAYAVVDLKIKPLGYKESDLQEILNNNPTYYLRNSDGTVGALIKEQCQFQPSTRDADDGALIDLSNETRAKGTMAGAAVGGAMGGFSAYQGAKSEISERWVTAVREYEDSLSNFMCVTGTRFLSKYNDYLEVPELKKPEEQQ